LESWSQVISLTCWAWERIFPAFNDADDQTPDGHFVTVISYNYWRRRFGVAPQIVGRKIRVNNYPFTILGVVAQGFNDVEIGAAPDLHAPKLGEERKSRA
jgi:hypothetical protein